MGMVAGRSEPARIALLVGARTVADEMVSAIELHWTLLDRVAGLLSIEQRRPGEPGCTSFRGSL